MVPSPGRIVRYTLTAQDASIINTRRQTSGVLFVGNQCFAGDEYPLIITKVWSSEPTESTSVNGQVLLDGNDSHWVTSVQQGNGEREWVDPQRVRVP